MKKIYILPLVLLLLVSCAGSQPSSELVGFESDFPQKAWDVKRGGMSDANRFCFWFADEERPLEEGRLVPVMN